MAKIEEIEQEIEELKKEYWIKVNELMKLKESKKEGKWKPEKGEEFWYRTSNGETMWSSRGTADPFSEWKINNLPIFKTNEDCKKYWHFMDTVKEKSYEFSREEWEQGNRLLKYYIEFWATENEFRVEKCAVTKGLGAFYFKSFDNAQYIIDNFKEELLKYFL